MLSKKSNAGGILILDFKLHYRAIVTKIERYRHKNRHKDQRNRKEDLEISLHSHSDWIFFVLAVLGFEFRALCWLGRHSTPSLMSDKGAKNIHWRKEETASSTNGAGETGYLHAKD
jgi:hypothetical protein